MTRKLTADRLEKLTVAELEAHLDEMRDEAPRPYLKEVMAVRNAKVRQEQYDLWGLTEEEYMACKAEAEAWRHAERDLHAEETRLAKAKARGDHKAAAETQHLERLQKAAVAARAAADDTPLHVLLNRARAKAIRETREARTAKASSASVGARGKGAQGGS